MKKDAPASPTDRQRRIWWAGLTAVALLALIFLSYVIFFGFISFLSWSYPILLPIGLAVIVALVLEPVVIFVEKRGLSRSTATLVVCLLTVIAFLLFWAYILPPLLNQAGSFIQSIPQNIEDGLAMLHDPAEGSPDSRSAIETWLKANLPAIVQEVQTNAVHFFYSALGPVGQAFGFILGFGFVPIYVYYFLADQKKITGHWHEYVPMRASPLRDEVVSVLGEINNSLVKYFQGQIVVAACNGVLTVLGLTLIGLKFSLVLGVMYGVLSIIPFLGIIVSIVPALLLAFLSAKGDPTWQWLGPLLVLLVFIFVQMCESMFITPRVQSNSTGLHPLAIIIGILFWSLLLPGLLGPVVAVPLTCAVVVLLRRYVWIEAKVEEKPPA